jgi:hypothetical protein
VHVATLVAAIETENVAAGQFVHGSEPRALLYVPALHWPHTPPAGPLNPATQRQAASALLATADKAFVGHSEHAADPVVALYFPDTQALQTPPSGPLYPVPQRQFEIIVFPVAAVLLLPGH